MNLIVLINPKYVRDYDCRKKSRIIITLLLNLSMSRILQSTQGEPKQSREKYVDILSVQVGFNFTL